MKGRRSLMVAVVMATLALVVAGCNVAPKAQEQARQEPSAAARPEPPLAQAPREPLAQGFTVHGHWVIDVQNADGTLKERREFENSLHDDAKYNLSGFLTRSYTPGLWLVSLGNPSGPGPGPCPSGPGNALVSNACFIAEPGSTAFSPGPNVSLNLVLTNNTFSGIVLSGTSTARQNGSITQVATLLERCPGTTAPQSVTTSCGGIYGFTSQAVSPPLSVSTNQSIAVTVTISYS